MGIFQFEPSTWERELNEKPEELLSLTAQTAAVGRYMQKTYHTMITHEADELDTIKRTYFNDNEDEFLRSFMAPVLINSYNAGTKRLRRVIEWFVQHVESVENSNKDAYPQGIGNDLFYTMVEAARIHHKDAELEGYGQDAREYTPRVYALAKLLEGHVN